MYTRGEEASVCINDVYTSQAADGGQVESFSYTGKGGNDLLGGKRQLRHQSLGDNRAMVRRLFVYELRTLVPLDQRLNCSMIAVDRRVLWNQLPRGRPSAPLPRPSAL